MALTPAQLKGRIKSIAAKNNADARLLMRIYMMDGFLERLSESKYKDNFIIKGGILVTSMLGVAMRATMDIDTSMKNLNLSVEDAQQVVTEIMNIELDDGVTFSLKRVSNIMDEMEYPGVRLELDALMGGMTTPIKIDISTGDVITPEAVEYSYDLLVEQRSIRILAYNLETVLGEKLQTILARGIYNTRMRDFYDVFALLETYKDQISKQTFVQAFGATCKKRGTEELAGKAEQIIETISKDAALREAWEQYRKKFKYASEISYETVIDSTSRLAELLK